MRELDSLYIERNNCENCYRCVRECGSKAVKVDADGVYIDKSRCVRCGKCIAVCKGGHIKLRDDVHLARRIIKENNIKVASLSSQWVTEFPDISHDRLIEALKLLGFTHVSETALGAEASLEKEFSKVRELRGGIGISARCPAVVTYIMKHRPRMKKYLLDVASPMIAHARMIRSWWGAGAKIIHIGSCIAAKNEASKYDDIVSAMITFRELRQWLKEEGIHFDNIQGGDGYHFEPFTAKKYLRYTGCGILPVPQDIITVPVSSMSVVEELLSISPRVSREPVWIDLMGCPQGCIGSNGNFPAKYSVVDRRLRMQTLARSREKVHDGYTLPHIDLSRTSYCSQEVDNFVAENDTLLALDNLGIGSAVAQTDCNACGYGTCRRFAKALTRGDVTRELCWQYVKNEVSSKLDTLITRLSAGVAIIGSNMRIEQSNRLLATMLGPETEYLYDKTPGFRDISCGEVFPFAHLVSMVLESGEDSLVRDIQVKENMITVSVHTIQKYKSVLVICRSLLFSQVRNEEIVARTQKVIDENLRTVRQIACMLGENASRTEAILNSILKAQKTGDGR